MKTRIIVSAVLLPIFFAVLFVFPPFVLTAVVSVICAIAAYELLCAAKVNVHKRILVYAVIAAALVPLAVYLSLLVPAASFAISEAAGSSSHTVLRPMFSPLLFATLILSVIFVFISLLIIEFVLSFKTEKQIKLRFIPIVLCAGIVIPYMLTSLISLKAMPFGHLFVLLPIIAAFLTDSGAYFVGMAIGKRKILPNISPNKTVEGFIGGIVIGVAGMMIYGIILANFTALSVIFPALIVYGLVGAVITEFGDLVFSFVKRKCGVKDYGRLIPGHGGVLDRFDSMIFTAPAMYFLVMALPSVVY